MNDFALSVGLSSIVAFVGFLGWAYSNRPTGINTVPYIGSESSTFILAALNTFTIHDFLLQYIVHHSTKKNYTKIIILTFVIGAVIVLLISMGSLGNGVVMQL